MSLSDSCCEISDDLARAFAAYCDWEYDLDHWVKIIDALYALNEVGAQLDIMPNSIGIRINEVADERVITSLLYQAAEAQDDAARKKVIDLIIKITQRHDRLKDGIIALTMKVAGGHKILEDFPRELLAEVYQRSTM